MALHSTTKALLVFLNIASGATRILPRAVQQRAMVFVPAVYVLGTLISRCILLTMTPATERLVLLNVGFAILVLLRAALGCHCMPFLWPSSCIMIPQIE